MFSLDKKKFITEVALISGVFSIDAQEFQACMSAEIYDIGEYMIGTIFVSIFFSE